MSRYTKKLYQRGTLFMNDYQIEICKIIIEKNTENNTEKKTLYDCNNQEIKTTNTMNRRYRTKRKNFISEENVAVVWILLAIDESEKEHYIQVGQNRNLTRMLSGDIGPDINEILNNRNKYSDLTSKYNTLIFYEINLSKYLVNIFDKDIPLIPSDDNFKKIYWTIIASCAEGKLAAEYKCKKEGKTDTRMWNPSPTGLDGYFYLYYNSKILNKPENISGLLSILNHIKD